MQSDQRLQFRYCTIVLQLHCTIVLLYYCSVQYRESQKEVVYMIVIGCLQKRMIVIGLDCKQSQPGVTTNFFFGTPCSLLNTNLDVVEYWSRIQGFEIGCIVQIFPVYNRIIIGMYIEYNEVPELSVGNVY